MKSQEGERTTAMLRLLSLLAIVCFSWLSILEAYAYPIYSIRSVTARLFYEGQGTFSDNILDRPDFAYWNTIIGEGSAGAPSSYTLVLIEVVGPPGEYGGDVKIEVSVTDDKGKEIMSRKDALGLISKSGMYFVPVFIYETGCTPLKVKAKLIGTGPSEIIKHIPFACGE